MWAASSAFLAFFASSATSWTVPPDPCDVPKSARIFTFDSPRALAMRATAPGWLSTEIVNCLVLAMPHLLVAEIIRLLRKCGLRPTRFAGLSNGRAGKGEFQRQR